MIQITVLYFADEDGNSILDDSAPLLQAGSIQITQVIAPRLHVVVVAELRRWECGIVHVLGSFWTSGRREIREVKTKESSLSNNA